MATYINPALDASGNGNNWTVNNINWTSESASTYDVMKDVPTLTSATASNFAVLNPLKKPANDSLTNANLQFTGGTTGTVGFVPATQAVSSGKWYFETTLVTSARVFVGIVADTRDTSGNVAASSYSDGYDYRLDTGEKRNNNTATSYGASLSNGDVLGCAFDLDNGKIWWSKNGVWQASGDPVAGTNAAYTGISGTFQPEVGHDSYASPVVAINFGQRPFAYTPPTGFVALNTFNLPTPTIGATASTQANKYMDINLYTGNSSNRTIVNSGEFAPALVWIKNRSGGNSHRIFDAVRGATKALASNLTNAEFTESDSLTAFNSNGFSLGADTTGGGVNTSGDSLVAWQWAGNGTGVSNTAGSITSTVSANTSSGFSVVTFTSPASGTCSVGHGLGVKPSMVIVKCRSVGNSGWFVWHQALGDNNTDYLMLHSTAAEQSYSTMWGTVGRTSTLLGFTQGGTLEANATHVAYAFSEVAGFSKFGSYTGNGSSDGTFVYTGFRPKYVLIRRTDSGNNWFVLDSARNTYNLTNAQLYPNASSAEATGSDCNIDILSNGFKLRTALDASNGSGGNYIYACFAENPFKYSLAR